MNAAKLRSIMTLNDDGIESLADYLDITRQTLSNKIAGRTDFTRHEMIKIKQRYQMSNEEFVETFDEKG